MNWSTFIAALIAVEGANVEWNAYYWDVIGYAAGRLAIHAEVVEDVNRQYGTNYKWPEDAQHETSARLICRAYISIYAKPESSWKTRAAIWNAGPGWRRASVKGKALAYAEKVLNNI